MSSSAVSAASQSLYQFFQRISSNSQSPASSVGNAQGAAAAGDSGQAVQGAGKHHHHGHGHGGGEDFKKIEAAVTDALQSAQANGSSDPNKTIEDAVAKVFQDSSGAPNATSTAPSADGSQNGAAAGTAPSQGDAAARQAFFQTLKSYGVDPQQFHKDLLAAMKDAMGGQTDASTAFKSFPPGVALDTAA